MDMISWNTIRDRIKGMNEGGYTYRTYYNSLIVIIDKAEHWNINPVIAKDATKSNLQEIIPEAKKAIKRMRKDRLEELFRAASTLSNKELRIYLRGDKREHIILEKLEVEGEITYKIELTEDQYEKIVKATEENYKYTIRGK